jgi:hypothetical protein
VVAQAGETSTKSDRLERCDRAQVGASRDRRHLDEGPTVVRRRPLH